MRYSGLRSDRNSLLAHNDRAGNYDPLIANLLGYAGGESSIRPETSAQLVKNLKQFDINQRCLQAGGASGFVYVGIDYGEADINGKIHDAHALLLHSVERDGNGDPTGVFLQNPWGNRRELEFFSIRDLLERNVRFSEYYPVDRN